MILQFELTIIKFFLLRKISINRDKISKAISQGSRIGLLPVIMENHLSLWNFELYDYNHVLPNSARNSCFYLKPKIFEFSLEVEQKPLSVAICNHLQFIVIRRMRKKCHACHTTTHSIRSKWRNYRNNNREIKLLETSEEIFASLSLNCLMAVHDTPKRILRTKQSTILAKSSTIWNVDNLFSGYTFNSINCIGL